MLGNTPQLAIFLRILGLKPALTALKEKRSGRDSREAEFVGSARGGGTSRLVIFWFNEMFLMVVLRIRVLINGFLAFFGHFFST